MYTRPDALVAEHIEAVASARFVYLTGTSPMHVRSVLKDTPLFEALVSAWNGGAVLAGSGAGADVVCDPMVDTRGGAFTVGLGVVPGLSVVARSNLWSPDKVRRTVDLAPHGVVVVELPERSALILDGGRWRTAGVGPVTVHREGVVVSLDVLPAPALG